MDMIECTEFDPEPHFYVNTVKVLAVLCTISILLALYLIIASSDQQSKLHRMNLFVLQLSLLLFNVIFSIIAIPVSYFPMTMGYAAGLMPSSPTPCYAAIVMVFISLDMANISVGGLIGYRIQMTIPPQHFMKKHFQRYIASLAVLFVVHPISYAVTGIVTHHNVINNDPHFELKFTCAQSVLKYASCTLNTKSMMPLMYSALVLLTIYVTYTLPLLFAATVYGQRAFNYSPSTKLLHKRVSVQIYLQGAAALYLFILPQMGIVIILAFSPTNTQTFGNVCYVLLAMYGFVSSSLLIISTKAYREKMISIFCRILFFLPNRDLRVAQKNGQIFLITTYVPMKRHLNTLRIGLEYERTV